MHKLLTGAVVAMQVHDRDNGVSDCICCYSNGVRAQLLTVALIAMQVHDGEHTQV